MRRWALLGVAGATLALSGSLTGTVLVLAVAAIVLALAGAVDDIRPLPAGPRFALQFIAVAAVVAATQVRVLPPEVPLRSYSYRAMENAAPADYRAALKAVHAPLLVIVGSRDEAFIADHYAGVIRHYSQGKAVIVPDATHNSVLNDGRTLAEVTAWTRRSAA